MGRTSAKRHLQTSNWRRQKAMLNSWLFFRLAQSLKMFQWQGQMDKQAGGIPFFEGLATKLMNDDLACELAAKSFLIWITVERRPALVLLALGVGNRRDPFAALLDRNDAFNAERAMLI